MTWTQTVPFIIPAAIALIVCIASHQFAAWRDRENKRREKRVEYLISAFRAVSQASHHPRLWEIADQIEQAISDIQFLGTSDQIKLAKEFAREIAEKQSANLDPL